MGRKLARRWKTEVQIWSVLKALDGAAGLENSHCLQEWHNRWLDVQRRWPGGAIWAWQRPLQVNTRDCCLNNTAKKTCFCKGGKLLMNWICNLFRTPVRETALLQIHQPPSHLHCSSAKGTPFSLFHTLPWSQDLKTVLHCSTFKCVFLLLKIKCYCTAHLEIRPFTKN